jgi:hypothetical protein
MWELFMWVQIALAVAVATSAPPSAQFNLNCSGLVRSRDTAQGDVVRETAWSDTIRVDLQENKFCDGDCDRPQAILQVSPDKIVFRQFKENYLSETYSIDRVTGGIWHLIIQVFEDDKPVHTKSAGWEGKCTPSAYTGMNNRLF